MAELALANLFVLLADFREKKNCLARASVANDYHSEGILQGKKTLRGEQITLQLRLSLLLIVGE